jgi:hypothetical protein
MDNILVRTDELVLYDDCIRFSVITTWWCECWEAISSK